MSGTQLQRGDAARVTEGRLAEYLASPAGPAGGDGPEQRPDDAGRVQRDA